MVSLLVLSLFLLVGMLDTLHYRAALPETNGGEKVYSPEVLSVFDKLVDAVKDTNGKDLFRAFGVDAVCEGKHDRCAGQRVARLSRVCATAARIWRMHRSAMAMCCGAH